MMTGYLNPHGTMPHLYPQFEGMWFDPDNNDVADEFDEPTYPNFAHELSDKDEDGFYPEADDDEDDYHDEDNREPPLQTMEEITKWVADRYWYILTEIETISKTAEAVTEVVPNGDTVCTCGGRRSTTLEIEPLEREEYMMRRRVKHGRGRLTEVSWKRHAGGGRRGRTTLRTMVAESTLDA